jgi:DNA-binding transcriptional ArsR family regulator
MEITKSSEQSIEVIAAAFAALGQPSRLRIVRLLLSAYPKGLPAGEIQKELNISAPTLSHHLDKLRQVGLVTLRKTGNGFGIAYGQRRSKSLWPFCLRSVAPAIMSLRWTMLWKRLRQTAVTKP